MISANGVLNLNIGVLGHVDSGKTSLCRALSTCESTAAFDRDPQSQARGITLDLGFSSFTTQSPPLNTDHSQFSKIRFTLVDCPGHASLLRTIIGGAQIIDLMILVIDALSGFQTQTGECLVIGEICCRKRLLVVLNKIDLCNTKSVDKLEKKVVAVLTKRSSFESFEIVRVSAKEGNVESIKSALLRMAYVPNRSVERPFLFYVDHCFQSKGQGLILTGTVIAGQTQIGSTLELPSCGLTCKIRSIQVFHEPTVKISQGDRAGISIQTKRANVSFERGIACEPKTVQKFRTILAHVKPIDFFKRNIGIGQKFHLTIAYATMVSKILAMFRCPDCLFFDHDHLLLREISENERGEFFVLLRLEDPVFCPSQALLIASKMDSDLKSNVCRLAFHGRFVEGWNSADDSEGFSYIRVFSEHERSGVVERIAGEGKLVASGMFENHLSVQAFSGMSVEIGEQRAVIEGPFGQKGKMVLKTEHNLGPGVEKMTKCTLKYKKYFHSDKNRSKMFQ